MTERWDLHDVVMHQFTRAVVYLLCLLGLFVFVMLVFWTAREGNPDPESDCVDPTGHYERECL